MHLKRCEKKGGTSVNTAKENGKNVSPALGTVGHTKGEKKSEEKIGTVSHVGIVRRKKNTKRGGGEKACSPRRKGRKVRFAVEKGKSREAYSAGIRVEGQQ